MTSTPSVHRSCPVCQADQPQPHWSKPPLSVVRCGRCSMLYANPVAAEFVSGEFYGKSSYHLSPNKLQSDFAPVRFERELKLFRQFCMGGNVLDVGCSSGAFLHQLKMKFDRAYEITGLDVPGAALEYARELGISVIATPFLEHDFGQQRFDAISFWAVLEHLPEPRRFLKKAADILRAGGFCFLLVPNARSLAMRLLGPRYRYVMPEHLNYFTRETLLRFVQSEARFQIRELRTMHFNPLVIWQDWGSRGNLVPEEERARLLKRTTALKQNPLLVPVKAVYQTTEWFLSTVGLADNLVLVLQRQGIGNE